MQPTTSISRTRTQLANLFLRFSIASGVLGFAGAALALSLPASGDAGWILLRRALLSVFIGSLAGLALALTSLALDAKNKRAAILILPYGVLLLIYAFIP